MGTNTTQNWLLLRGLTREAAHWGDFLTQLQHAFPQARIHCVDLPGSGAFYKQLSPCSINEITEQVRAQARKNGWLNEKPRLLTLSLGGMVAWEWLQRYPDEIHSAVLINSSLASVNPFYQRLRWQAYSKLAQIICQPDVAQRELAIVKLVSNRASAHEKIAAEWANIQQLRPVTAKNTLQQLMAAACYVPTLHKPTPPVLLLNGLGDRLVSPKCSENISARWHLPLMSHPWAGHDLCIDDGNWVIAQLQQWQY